VADIDALKQKYFTSVPTAFSNSKITPLIDTPEFNSQLEAALSSVGTAATPSGNVGHFIFIANWWLGFVGGALGEVTLSAGATWTPSGLPPYVLSSGNLKEILKEKARRGVDVRVLGWVSTTIMDTLIARLFEGIEDHIQLNLLTIKSIEDLRAEPAIGDKAALNVISHSAGGVHAKVVVIGTATEAIGFTGGLDFVANRLLSTTQHDLGNYWHDIVAKVEGPAVQGLYDWFKDFWRENLQIDGNRREPIDFRVEDKQITHIGSTAPSLPDRTYLSLSKGKHHVQSLRTLPARNYQILSFEPPPDSFPKDGVFELRNAWYNAIRAAESYIYIEDQAFWSQELLLAINSRILTNSNLRVILVFSGKGDPNDPALDDAPILTQSINHGLLEGLTPAQLNQVRMFQRYGAARRVDFVITDVTPAGPIARIRTTISVAGAVPQDRFNPEQIWLQAGAAAYRVVGNDPLPAGGGELTLTVEAPTGAAVSPGAARLIIIEGVLIHAKTTLIDDHWALIGSANCMRRSLYTDAEHCIAVVDEDDQVVKEYRKRLWAHHFLHPNPDDFENLAAALHAWDPAWGTPGAAPARPTRSGDPGPEFLRPVSLPLTEVSMSTTRQLKYDKTEDPDSREAWGLLP
jgi:phosphatidylserine/phosphatidylglycerophosphate/cardiolipin synthase-like enzyme